MEKEIEQIETTPKPEAKENKAKPKSRNNSLASQLMKIEKLFDTLTEVEEAKSLAATIGYDEAKVKEGAALAKRAKEVCELKDVAKGRSLSLSQMFSSLKDEVNREYINQLMVVRNEMGNDLGMLDKMQARGRRPGKFVEWASDVEAFYENSIGNEEFKAKAQSPILEEKKLKASQKKFNDLKALFIDKEQHSAESKRLTLERNEALNDIQRWINHYRSTARFSFLRDQQKRIILGV